MFNVDSKTIEAMRDLGFKLCVCQYDGSDIAWGIALFDLKPVVDSQACPTNYAVWDIKGEPVKVYQGEET